MDTRSTTSFRPDRTRRSGTSHAPSGRGRLRAAIEQLPPEAIEAIAQRVAELLRHDHVAPRLIDADQLARQLGLTRGWVYQHAQELGAIRLGHGPKARLRFDPTTAAAALADGRSSRPSSAAAPSSSRRRPRPMPASSDDLLPIRSRALAARSCPVVARPSE